MAVNALTAATFDGHIADHDLVLVDFWADWCAPCHAMAPAIEELAGEAPGGVSVVSVDTVAEPALAERFGVVSLPTVMVFAGGELVQRSSGVKRLAQLRLLVDQHASGAAS